MENNQTLAVKYRPQLFEDLVGQDITKSILINQIRKNKIKQSYIFAGMTGSGKTTTARIFAKSISQEPIIEINASSHNGIDDIRELTEQSKKVPLVGKYKVFILDEVQIFSKSAWDCFLKLLEEPPVTAVFILCTTELDKVPETIKNRVQILYFSKLSDDDIFERLKHICFFENGNISRKEAIHYDIDALKTIAIYADGSMRQAISFLEQCINLSNKVTEGSVRSVLGISSFKVCFDTFKTCMNFNEHFCDPTDIRTFICDVDTLSKDGISMKMFVDDLLKFTFNIFKLCMMKTEDYNYDENIEFTSLPKFNYIKDFYITMFIKDFDSNINRVYNFLETLKKLKSCLGSNNDVELVQMMLLSFIYSELN